MNCSFGDGAVWPSAVPLLFKIVELEFLVLVIFRIDDKIVLAISFFTTSTGSVIELLYHLLGLNGR